MSLYVISAPGRVSYGVEHPPETAIGQVDNVRIVLYVWSTVVVTQLCGAFSWTGPFSLLHHVAKNAWARWNTQPPILL